VQATIHRDPVGTGQRAICLGRSLAFALGAMLVTGVAPAAGGDLAEAQARYQQERAVCISGQSHQDRDTCLREAGAELQAAKLGKLAEGSGSYEQNQLARCERLPASDRDDCVRRLSDGTVSGSVEGGGIYRELRTTVPAPAPVK
jgi:hypothetical protein